MTFGAASIINSGHLDGALSMIGQGRNSYDGSLGTINGVISGGDKADTIQGGHGTEVVRGNNGGDIIAGGAGDDDLFGDVGRDLLRGQAGDDALTGGKGNDRIYGGSGEDTLRGGSENDRLFGGEGDDTLTGDDGRDTFVYRWDGGNRRRHRLREQRRSPRPDRVRLQLGRRSARLRLGHQFGPAHRAPFQLREFHPA